LLYGTIDNFYWKESYTNPSYFSQPSYLYGDNSIAKTSSNKNIKEDTDA